MNQKGPMLHWILSICLGLAMFLSGCAAARVPLFIEQDFTNRRIDAIALMPIVDVRKDKSAANLDLEGDVRIPLKKQLSRKGYSVATISSFKDGMELTPDTIAEMDEKDLATLGPPESAYLLLFYLEDLSTSYVVFAKTSKIEASAVLVDKARSQYLWRDKCVESVGQGGLISGFLPIQGMAVEQCILNMLSGLPEKNSDHK